jgi:leucyl aminopeptidase
MRGMKRDMAGAAAVLGAFVALTRLAPTAPHLENRPIEAWFAVTDNLLGPDSSKPDDVVTAVCGTTIEVVHTDAEGRMILADTLALASGKAPKDVFREPVRAPALLLDVATLTGSAIGAVSNTYGAVFSSRDDHSVFKAIVDAGRSSGERLWPLMPVDEASGFLKALESDIADVLQCRVASESDHIYAAAFLQTFVSTEVPWLHLDAAAASHDSGLAHVRNGGATGFGVRAVLALVLDHWQALSANDDDDAASL